MMNRRAFFRKAAVLAAAPIIGLAMRPKETCAAPVRVGIDVGREGGDETAVAVLRNGVIGIVERFMFYESPPMVMTGQFLGDVDVYPWKVWSVKDDDEPLRFKRIDPIDMYLDPQTVAAYPPEIKCFSKDDLRTLYGETQRQYNRAWAEIVDNMALATPPFRGPGVPELMKRDVERTAARGLRAFMDFEPVRAARVAFDEATGKIARSLKFWA